MRRVVLHVGLPKTGTTALQTWLRTRDQALGARGVSYPYLPGLTEYKHDFVVPALRSRKMEPLRELLRTDAAGTLLLSNEGFTNHFYDFDKDALADFRAWTASLAVEIILVTRDPGAWLKSYHRQCVFNPNNGASELWGTALSLDQLAGHPRIRQLTDHERLQKDLVAGFGAGRLLHLRYEEDWFGAVLRHLGLADMLGDGLPRLNVSMPDWAVELLRQVNGHKPSLQVQQAWAAVLRKYLERINRPLQAVTEAQLRSCVPQLDRSLLQAAGNSPYFRDVPDNRAAWQAFADFLDTAAG